MGFVIELLAALVLFGSLLGYLIHNNKITSASLEFFAKGFLKLIAFFIVSTLVVFSYLFYQDRAIVPFEFVGLTNHSQAHPTSDCATKIDYKNQ